MSNESSKNSFAALLFPRRGGDTSVIYVSTPPPSWLGEDDLTKIVVEEAGVYCLFFLVPSKCGTAEFAINGNSVRGSETFPHKDALCNSAVCSIREPALPCSLEVRTKGTASGGILVIARVDV